MIHRLFGNQACQTAKHYLRTDDRGLMMRFLLNASVITALVAAALCR